MQNNHLDLRVVKTKEAIQNALFDLMEEKGFEAITVKDITTKAKLNRGTFYTHYENKFDLINKYQENFMSELSGLFKWSRKDLMDESEQSQSAHNPRPSFIISIIEFLNHNHRFLKIMLDTQGNLSFQIKLKNFIQENLFENNDALLNQEDLLVPAPYYTAYVVSAFLGVIRQWLYNGGKESAVEVAQILSILNLKGPFSAVGLQQD